MKTKLMLCTCWLGQKYHSLRQSRLITDKKGFGMNELLGIAAALILAAFIIIPSLKDFAQNVMNGLDSWWDKTIVSKIFPTT